MIELGIMLGYCMAFASGLVGLVMSFHQAYKGDLIGFQAGAILAIFGSFLLSIMMMITNSGAS